MSVCVCLVCLCLCLCLCGRGDRERECECYVCWGRSLWVAAASVLCTQTGMSSPFRSTDAREMDGTFDKARATNETGRLVLFPGLDGTWEAEKEQGND